MYSRNSIAKISQLVFSLALVATAAAPARAAEPDEITGIPVVECSGQIMLEGKNISLWGITTLARDQQCWHGEMSWPCGEHATMALKHLIEGLPITCRTASEPTDNKPSAQCYRQKGEGRQDIARLLVRHGWALDHGDVSGGLYADDQDDAREKRRGIWTSRFQMPEDWVKGIQKYVEYEMAPPPVFAPHVHHESGEHTGGPAIPESTGEPPPLPPPAQ